MIIIMSEWIKDYLDEDNKLRRECRVISEKYYEREYVYVDFEFNFQFDTLRISIKDYQENVIYKLYKNNLDKYQFIRQVELRGLPREEVYTERVSFYEEDGQKLCCNIEYAYTNDTYIELAYFYKRLIFEDQLKNKNQINYNWGFQSLT